MAGCQICGKELLPRSKGWRPTRFCSNDCKFVYQRDNPPHRTIGRARKNCLICGTEFSYYASVRQRAQFCSNVCRQRGQRDKMLGKRYVTTYVNSASFRSVARGQLPKNCALCGWSEGTCDVCHIVARKNGGRDEMDNVVILCPNHHRMFDSGKIAVEEIRALAKHHATA